MNNSINWFEIPVSQMARATRFYSQLFDSEVQEVDFNGMKMAMLPSSREGVGGALVEGKPSGEGPLVYLNGGNDLSHALSRIEKAGGKVVVPKTQISPEIGYFAIFMDSENNRIALHSRK